MISLSESSTAAAYIACKIIGVCSSSWIDSSCGMGVTDPSYSRNCKFGCTLWTRPHVEFRYFVEWRVDSSPVSTSLPGSPRTWLCLKCMKRNLLGLVLWKHRPPPLICLCSALPASLLFQFWEMIHHSGHNRIGEILYLEDNLSKFSRGIDRLSR